MFQQQGSEHILRSCKSCQNDQEQFYASWKITDVYRVLQSYQVFAREGFSSKFLSRIKWSVFEFSTAIQLMTQEDTYPSLRRLILFTQEGRDFKNQLPKCGTCNYIHTNVHVTYHWITVTIYANQLFKTTFCASC